MSGGGRLQRIEEYRRRISTGLGLDHFGPSALSSNLQLFDSRRAKRVSRAQENCLPLRSEDLGQLSYRRSFASAVHADDENHFRDAVYLLNRRGIALVEDREKLFL